MEKNLLKKRIVPVLMAGAVGLSVTAFSGAKMHFADAGNAGGYVVDSSTFSSETGVSNSEWRVPLAGVSFKDGKLCFDNTYDVEDPLISRTEAFASSEVSTALDVKYTIEVKEIVGNKKFGFVYGIPRLDKDAGEKGSTFVYVTKKDNKTLVGATHYGDTEETLLTETEIAANELNFQLTVTSAGKLTVTVNEKKIYLGNNGESVAAGFLGFSSMGSYTSNSNYINVNLSDVKVYNEYYAKPESPIISSANFDNNMFNANEWALKNPYWMVDGSGIKVTDTGLKFDGGGYGCMFSNKFKHSDFELQYDIKDAINTPRVASNGKVLTASYWQAVWFGNDVDGVEGLSSDTSKAMLYFDAAIDLRVNIQVNGETVKNPDLGKRTGKTQLHFTYMGGWGHADVPEKYGFFNEGYDGEPVRVRVRVIDGVLTVGVKHKSEVVYTEIFRYAFENKLAPLGYVSLGSSNNEYVPSTYKDYITASYFTLDDIKIFNYDKNPTSVDIPFVSNRKNSIADYDYVDRYTDDYMIWNTGGKPSGKK